ncbi:MAG TPA: hypothetical protein ENN09_03085 [Planctomycetes bacterium]|nr:hypothetical protein [Planctomycetota bacterium]
MKRLLFLLSLPLIPMTATAGELCGPALATDDPFYPGIGRFRDISAVISAAYSDAGNPQDNTSKALALWKWMLLHLYHGSSRPIEPMNNVEGVSEEAQGVYDTMKMLASYQFAICYASASAMCGLFEAAGFPARARGISGHTVPECFFDEGWRYLDHDMCGVAFKKDQKSLASVDELTLDPSLIDWDYRAAHNIPQFPWDGGPGSRVMKGAFGKKASDCTIYNDAGTAVHPTNLRLRRGETFTRYFNYDRAPWGNRFHWTGLTDNPKYFPQGPARNLTFVFDPPVDGKNDGRPRPPYVFDGLARYGNGLFEYVPELASGVYREGADAVKNVEDGGSPKIKGGPGGGEVVFRQWTPYAICGAPEGTDPWGKVSDAVVVSGKAVGAGVKVALSNNGGVSWESRTVAGDFAEDFSMMTRGRYSYLVKIELPEGAGLDDLKIRTVTMCAPSMMPHLHDGNNVVRYSADNLGVVLAEPDLSSRERCMASWHALENVDFNDHPIFRCPVKGGTKPSYAAMKLSAPAEIKRVACAFMVRTSNPPRQNCIVAIQVSPDGRQWKDAIRKTLAIDANHWRHWFSADVPFSGGSEAYVRLEIVQNGTPADIARAVAYAYYDAGPAPELEIEHAWKEGSSVRSFRHRVKAGASEERYTVSCGANVTNLSVKFAVPNNAALPAAVDAAAGGTAEAVERSRTVEPAPLDPEKKAATLLHVAKNLYLKNNMFDQARARLEQVIREYPETDAAKEARSLLQTLP